MAFHTRANVKRSLLGCLVTGWLLCLAVFAQASPPGWLPTLPEPQKVGQGELRRWGFLIYEASLWAPQGIYRIGEPFALSLRYTRDVSADRIVQASLDEMSNLGAPIAAHPEWTLALQRALVDVKRGDTVTGLYVPGQGARFFHNGQATGEIDDRLARSFFAIWLDPRTSAPELRQALLGASP